MSRRRVELPSGDWTACYNPDADSKLLTSTSTPNTSVATDPQKRTARRSVPAAPEPRKAPRPSTRNPAATSATGGSTSQARARWIDRPAGDGRALAGQPQAAPRAGEIAEPGVLEEVPQDRLAIAGRNQPGQQPRGAGQFARHHARSRTDS